VARINQLISLGHLPNNLTVEKIRTGNSNIRNPILVSYVPKGLLPYHGLGSGIKRALEAWPQIDFVDDHDGCLFTATVHRKPVEQLELAGPELKTPVKTPDLVLQLLKERPDMTLAEVAETIGKSLSAVERASVKLVKAGHLNMSALAKEDTGRLSSENPGYRNHQQQSSAGAQCVRLLQR
jgi:ATP-dependent DNA helicase RecG